MIVADTNLVIYLVLPGQYTPAAESVRAMDRHWFVPTLFRFEFQNVLATYVGSGRMQRDDALKYYRRGMAFVTVSDFVPEPLSIFNLVVRGQCSAYDAEFVALAEHLGVRLVTADKALIRAFPDVTTDLAQIAT